MLLVFPVSKADHDLAVKLAGWMAELGGVHGHPILLAYAPSCPEPSREALVSLLSRCTERFHQVKLPVFAEVGWPGSPNLMFKSTALYVERAPEFARERGWYFFEPDCTPTAPGWLDALAEEYRKCGTPFFGVRHHTRLTNAQGVERIDGDHMVGTGIYPIRLSDYFKLHRFLGTDTKPFDVFLQWAVQKAGLTHTELIQHNWGSRLYERSGGKIICKPLPGKDLVSIFDPVRDNAVVVHGCKDGTLIDVLRGGSAQEPPPIKRGRGRPRKVVANAPEVAQTRV